MSGLTKKAKRKAAYKAATKRRIAYSILFIIQFVAGISAGAVTAAFVLPTVYEKRGYVAFGGEWLLIILISYLAFCLCNRIVFRKIQGA